MEARGDEVIPEFLPKEYVSLERCELCQRAKLNATTGSPSSPMNLATRVTTKANPKAQSTFHYGSFNEVDTGPLQPREAPPTT